MNDNFYKSAAQYLLFVLICVVLSLFNTYIKIDSTLHESIGSLCILSMFSIFHDFNKKEFSTKSIVLSLLAAEIVHLIIDIVILKG